MFHSSSNAAQPDRTLTNCSEQSVRLARTSRKVIALPAETLASRLSVFTQIIRILTKTVPEVRASKTRWRPRRESDDKPLSEPNE